MSQTKIIVGLGVVSIAGIAYYAYKQYQIASEVDYEFKNFRISDASANNAVIGADVVIDNKTNLDLKVYGINLVAKLDGVEIGKVSNKTQTLLPKKKKSSIPIAIKVNLSSLGTSLNSIVSNIQSIQNAKIEIKGNMDFGASIFRVNNYEFDYDENLASIVIQSL